MIGPAPTLDRLTGQHASRLRVQWCDSSQFPVKIAPEAENSKPLHLRAAEQAVHDCLKRMNDALVTGDHSAFFQAASQALQERPGSLGHPG